MARRERNEELSYNEIPDMNEDWGLDPRNGKRYAGEAVQRFLKEKITSAIKTSAEKMGATFLDGANMKFYTFRSAEDMEKYMETGDISLILSVQDIQFAGKQRRIVISSEGGTNVYFTSNSASANLILSYESQEKEMTGTEWSDVIEDAYFTVAIDKGATGRYDTIIENQFVQYGSPFTFDLKPYLQMGVNRLKVTAIGASSEQVGSLAITANLTTMYLQESSFAWWKPFIEGQPYSLGGVNIGGSLNKTLYVKVTNETGYSRTYDVNMGTDIYVNNSYYFTGLEFPAGENGGTGVYNVELWLDADGLQSDHLSYNMMFVSEADASTAQLVCVSNIAPTAMNYADNTLLEYAVYNGGSIQGSPHVKVTAIINTNPSVLIDETLSGVQTETAIPFEYNLGIETVETNLSLDVEFTYGISQKVMYAVDNSKSYPAVTGASFYLNPSNRNNAQSNYLSVINDVTKGSVMAQWTNMSWIDGTDGWTVDDRGRKCLYLPAFTKSVIEYRPFYNVGTGKTIEFTYRIANAADSNADVITVMEGSTDRFEGIRIRPNEILVHSANLNTDDINQRYTPGDEELINVIVTVVRNYKTNYGNLCKIYVNGAVKKEFEFADSDDWISNSFITLGCDSADLYLYGMRVYDRAFESIDALKNYISSLPNSAEKYAAATLIDSIIDDSYSVSYDKARLVANVATIEMLNGAELPRYGLSKEYNAQCNLSVEWASSPEDNYVINDVRLEGQGTTSMNYWRWNLRQRGDKSKNMSVTYADGTTEAGGNWWFYGKNKGIKINRATAKINYASSMQSHKMGATAAFNDLHHALGLDNEAGGRVAVFQEPFYFFEKIPVEGAEGQYIYRFMGLFTFGADKGDKATFGYDNPEYKDKLIDLEGTDHSIKGVGMDYPYGELKYVLEEESICVDKGNNAYDAAWEVGNSGDKQTESEIQAFLDEEFQGAYNVAYENSTMIMGTDETLESINADVNAWGLRKDDNGHAFQRFEFWIDGEYDLYFLSRKTNTYVKNGTNLLTQLGLSASDIEGMTVAEKNEHFKQLRRARFKAQAPSYWHIDDTLFNGCFLILNGASDNWKKNSYPYKFALLSEGGRWRWRNDDLDTLFDINNQAIPDKNYNIEYGDWTDSTKSAYVFKGEDSVFWTLIMECYPAEIKAMGRRMLQAMYDLSNKGTTTIDKLMGFYHKYFWDKAQNYFTKSAYNADAEYKYEEAWVPYKNGSYDVDVHPLQQSLGDHLEAEMNWVRKRLIYVMSMWGFGPFAQYTDTCLGRINFRTQLAQGFDITPAMDMYPALLSGQGAAHTANERVSKGESVNIGGVGGTNTNVYIMAADELEDIGDLSTLAVDSANATLGVASKRLQRLKIGDEAAENVTSNVTTLNMGTCNSLTSVDARNLASLSGTVDLSNCPRIQEALFGGTDVRSINFANGSKITHIQLPSSLTALTLRNLYKLVNLEYADMTSVQFFRVENCESASPFEMLKSLYETEGNTLRDIRIIGFRFTGDATDVNFLAALAETTDEYGSRKYNGIDNTGVAQRGMLPVVEGYITIDGNVYRDTYETVLGYFPNAVLSFNGEYYVRFADAEVQRICNTKWGDGIGVTKDDLAAVTSITNQFSGNANIYSFEELGTAFPNLTTITSGFGNCTNMVINDLSLPNLTGILGNVTWSYPGFYGCKIKRVSNLGTITSLGIDRSDRGVFQNNLELTEVVLPETITTIDVASFAGNTAMITCNLPEAITHIGYGAFSGCSNWEMEEINLPNLRTFSNNGWYQGVFKNCSKIRRVVNLGSIKFINSSYGDFQNCTSLEEVILPSTLLTLNSAAFSGCTALRSVDFSGAIISSVGGFSNKPALTTVLNMHNISAIGDSAFKGCTALESIDSLKSCTSIGKEAFKDCTALHSINLTACQTVGDSAFKGCTALESIDSLKSCINISKEAFKDCTALHSINLTACKTVGDSAFVNCGDGQTVVNLPNVETIHTYAFYKTKVREINIGGTIESILDIPSSSMFGNNSSLQTVTLPTQLKSLGARAFNSAEALESINLDYVETIGEYCFCGCTALSIAINLENLTSIENGAFNGAGITEIRSLGTITLLPNGSSDTTSVFGKCKSLVKAVLPSTLITLGHKTFYSCAALIDIRLQEGLESIGDTCFPYCTSLPKIIIPSTVTSIGQETFYNCSSLMWAVILPEVPPTLGSRAFQGTNLSLGIYVPDESVGAYKTATNWSSYASKIYPLSEYVEPTEESEE